MNWIIMVVLKPPTNSI